MSVPLCPECEAEIKFDSPVKVGERVSCPECDTELEVISAKPLTLDYALDDEEGDEDWEDE